VIAPLLFASLAAAQPACLVLDDFESDVDWEGTVAHAERHRSGGTSAAWLNHPDNPVFRAPAEKCPTDWSGFDRLTFWAYSEVANRARMTLVLESENREDTQGWDYYFYHFQVDWTGWKQFSLHLGDGIRPTRNPRGWDQIDGFYISASGWQNTALPDTALYIDDIVLERDLVSLKLGSPRYRETPQECRNSWHATVANRGEETRTFRLELNTGKLRCFEARLTRVETRALAPGESDTVTLALRTSRAPGSRPLVREECSIKIADPPSGMEPPQVTVDAVTPLPAAEHPCLLATPAELRAAKRRAEKHEWARAVYDKVIAEADAATEEIVVVPDTGGQWTHYYSCPKHGRHLKGESPTRHVCPVDGEVFSGWPYDEVHISYIHHGYTRKLQSLGLAYAWVGDEQHAETAREILLQYADKYSGYEIHNSRGKVSNSGAKRFAQTLDEAVDLIRVAWAYDLIYNSPSLTGEDRARIEDDFLRPSCDVIMRNRAGISNWQTWHNAGVAAVAFCLRDTALARWAIDGPHGFRFQMAKSVLPDGFWYEGAAAYHFYSVRALVYTAEAARNAGVDLYGDERLRSLFDAPLTYVMPDLEFPAVNDSDRFALGNQEAVYTVAAVRWGDPRYLAVASLGGVNSLEALLLGPDETMETPLAELESRDFAGLGAAVLRSGVGDEAAWLHLDYGPHGGGHGHPDKLTLILHGLGIELAPDPGRLAYSVPLHGSWYRQTVAHNTIVVDQGSQRATEGSLDLFHVGEHFQVMSASSDGAYASVALRRTVALLGDAIADITTVDSDEEHTYDWVWHNRGELTAGLPLEPLDGPIHGAGGYQHIAAPRQAATSATWAAAWDLGEGKRVRLTMAGAPGTTVFTGHGPGQPPSEEIPLVLARRLASRTVFATLYELRPSREPVTLEVSRTQEGTLLAWVRNGAEATLSIRGADGTVTAEYTGPGGAETARTE